MVTTSKVAHEKSRKLAEMHAKMLESTKKHGNALGMLHSAHEAHEKHIFTEKNTEHHHMTAATKAEYIVKMAKEVERTALEQARIAGKIARMAEVAAHAHATVITK